jgi:hypothetical protein
MFVRTTNWLVCSRGHGAETFLVSHDRFHWPVVFYGGRTEGAEHFVLFPAFESAFPQLGLNAGLVKRKRGGGLTLRNCIPAAAQHGTFADLAPCAASMRSIR